MGLLLFLVLLVLELGELLGYLWTVWADLPMVTKFTPLAKLHLTHVAREGLLTRVCIFVLFLILGKAEGFDAEATLEILFRVMFFVVTL